MEFRHLRYFVAVAEERHITRAAERLGIQQPPLSQQIRALEDEVGVRLFRRLPRGVELTDAGQSFFEDAQAILANVDAALSRVKRTARGEQGRLAVGFTSSAPHNPLVPGVIRAYQDEFPDVSLTLTEDGTGALAAAVLNETIDVAFVRSNMSDQPDLRILKILEERMVVALPENHALAKKSPGKPLSLSAFSREGFILYRRQAGPGLFDAIIGACRQAGFSPDIVQEAPQIVSTLNLVAAGLGISIVPSSLASMAMPGIVFRQLKERPKLTAPLNLACRKTDFSETATRFARLVRKMAAGENT